MRGYRGARFSGVARFVVLMAMACPAVAGAAPAATLVKDFNTNTKDSFPYGFFQMSASQNAPSYVYFGADDGIHGRELWRTRADGTGTPEMVADINPGPAGSKPRSFSVRSTTLLGATFRTLYFVADDGVHGEEPWRSSGSAAGTVLVKDINPGSAGSDPRTAAELSDTMYFPAESPATGREMFKSDGTADGTTVAFDIPGASESRPTAATVIDGRLLFTAQTATQGRESFASDGTTAVQLTTTNKADMSVYDFVGMGTTAYFFVNDASDNLLLYKLAQGSNTPTLVKNTGAAGGSGPQYLAVAGSLVYWAQRVAGDYRLFKSDGTNGGTGQLSFGADGTNPSRLTDLGGVLYFYGEDNYETTLYRSNGTTTAAVSGAPTSSSGYRDIIGASGRVYFNFEHFGDGWELWQAGASGATKIATYPEQINLSTGVGTNLFFNAEDETTGSEPWFSNATGSGTKRLGDINTITDDIELAAAPFAAGGRTLVGAQGQLWATDGTPAGTSVFVPLTLLSGGVTQGGMTYFQAYGAPGNGLYKTDGTAGHTTLAANAPGGSTPVVLGDAVYFLVTDINSAQSFLRRSDGTVVKSFSGYLASLDVVSGRMYFTIGNGLWASDGSANGTVKIHDLGTDKVRAAAAIDGGAVLFVGPDSGNPGPTSGLYRSDGTAAGTTIVRAGVSGLSAVSVGGVAVFRTGKELWRTDGTDGGTYLLKNFDPQTLAGSVVAAGGIAYLAAGDRLWRSDGTVPGTRQIDAAGEIPGLKAEAAGSILYLAVKRDGKAELAATDGTEPGTRVLTTLGAQGVNFISMLGVTNGRLYFIGEDTAHGRELWSIVADYDGDGVSDETDRCATVAGTTADGCVPPDQASNGGGGPGGSGGGDGGGDKGSSSCTATGPEIFGNVADENCDGIVGRFRLTAAAINARFGAAGRITTLRTLEVTKVPAGARVIVRCSNPADKLIRNKAKRSCPFAKRSRKFRTARAKVGLRGLFKNRSLAPGTKLTILISVPGQIGKSIVFTTRANKGVKSKRACLAAGATKRTSCT